MGDGENRLEGALRAYAAERRLSYTQSGTLPSATPLLCRGGRRRAEHLMNGEMPGGGEGTLAHYTYTEVDSDGPDRDYPHTVLLTRIPEALGTVPTVMLWRSGIGAGISSIGTDYETVRHESTKLASRYRIGVPPDQDENAVRQLFSPSFVDWLATEPPEQFFFELEDGMLCVALARQPVEPSELDSFRDLAAHVHERIRDEAREIEGLGRTGVVGGSPVQRAVEKVRFEEPPSSVAVASRPFRGLAARDRRPWLQGLLTGVIGFFVLWDFLDVMSAAVSAGAAVVVALLATFLRIRTRSTAYGRVAFAREYARAHGLRPESPRQFHAENVGLPIPGAAWAVMSGPIPGTDLEGSLVLLSERTGAQARREYAGLVTKAPRGMKADSDPPPTLDGLTVRVADGKLALFTLASPAARRSADELDAFRRHAGEAVRSLQ